MTPVEGAGRHIDTPAQFAGGEGAADPRLVAALGEGRGDAVLALLTEGVRLLVPIVAVRDDVDADGADTSSHMASVSLVQPDGRRGMLAFTSLETMRAWDPTARPVPVRTCDVAAAALAEGADGVLVDIAGPIRFALDGESLHRVAESA